MARKTRTHEGGKAAGSSGFSRSTGRVFATVCVIVVASLLAGCGSGESVEGIPGEVSRIGFSEEVTSLEGMGEPEILVASDMGYPPFSFAPRKGPKGFDIALMDEVARRAGFEVEYRNARFDFITRGLVEGIYDASISAMTITENRKGQADFSDPYYNVEEALVVQSGSGIGSTGDLGQEETLGVQLGTLGQAEAGELLNAGGVGEVRAYRTVEEAFAALEGGVVDGVVYDLPAAQGRAERSGGELEVVEVIPTGEQYGIAFPEESPLVGPVNGALREMKEDGTYEEIYEEWIGRPPERMP